MLSFSEELNFFLQTYGTIGVIKESDGAVLQFMRPLNMSQKQCARWRAMKLLRCGELYDEWVSKGVFTEQLRETIDHSMRSY